MQGFNLILPNDERSKTVILLFRIYIVIIVVGLLTEIGTVMMLGDMSMDTMFVRNIQLLIIASGLISLVKLIFLILLAVYFIMWMRRAYHNLHKAGSKYLRHSEGWAAGAWFIPFANLVWPIQIIRDIWIETQNVFRKQNETYEKEVDNITGAWWAMYLISGIVSNIGGIFIRSRELFVGNIFIIIGDAGYILAAIFTIKMVSKISQMEANMLDRSTIYYAWVDQQNAQQYQQQNNPYAQQQSQENYYGNQDTGTKPPEGF